ncbi:MAG: hypothetical protein PVI75_00945 [Gammaproteobacteria bacterium]|jgi:hypothetical protein
MFRIKNSLLCLVCGLLFIPIFAYAVSDTGVLSKADDGYAPVVIGGKTLLAKFVSPTSDNIVGFQLTFLKKAEFLEKVVYHVAGMEVKAATERFKMVEILKHGKYTYDKLGCNRAKLTIVLGEKQLAHPAGSTLVMQLKFNSETSGSFVGNFTKNGSHELKGVFELR